MQPYCCHTRQWNVDGDDDGGCDRQCMVCPQESGISMSNWRSRYCLNSLSPLLTILIIMKLSIADAGNTWSIAAEATSLTVQLEDA